MTLRTMGRGGEINAVTMTQDTSQELECQAWEPGVMHVPAEEETGGKKLGSDTGPGPHCSSF